MNIGMQRSVAITIPTTQRTTSNSSNSSQGSTSSSSSQYSQSAPTKPSFEPTNFTQVDLTDNERYIKLLSNSGGFKWSIDVLAPRYRDRYTNQKDLDEVPVQVISLDD
ncbi:hypothetical protein SmJEL517_g01280 [Synchytrium microbalum]|uniref:Uncharacterized protein n=1 Tax=Synchytrium microbalum TaxID=1806994 RepID=A0A507CB99_9FUNG|nr:uncharacterized protein SmJEL517_g01280 [Synchytrium microbalum]TPX36741.1 hypothetical protein SmJEL517_g01280 [Synchytrium microbalum]